MKKHLNKILTHIVFIVISSALIFIFQDLFLEICYKVADCSLSLVHNQSFAVFYLTAFSTILSYIIYLKKNYNKKCNCIRLLLYSLYLLCFLALYLYLNTFFIYYSTPNGISYILSFIVTLSIIVFCEFIRYLIQKYHQKRLLIKRNKHKGFIIEHPIEHSSQDRMLRSNHAEILAQSLLNTHSTDQQFAFNVLINEKYGVGKTSFINLTKDKIKESSNAIIIDFNPWLYGNSKNMISGFFRLLTNKLHLNNYETHQIYKYVQIIIDSFDKNIGSIYRLLYNEIPQSAEYEYQKINGYIKDEQKAIFVFIDDVDRLTSNEIISLLQLIRNTANFPNIFYIVASDRKYLEKALEKSNIDSPKLFLDKFFNLEITLPPEDNDIQRILLDKITIVLKNNSIADDSIITVIKQIKQNTTFTKTLKSPRDVYRLINLYYYTLSTLNIYQVLSEINLFDVFALTYIQYLDVNVYVYLRDFPNELLEEQYGTYKLKQDWANAFCSKHHKEIIKRIEKRITNENDSIIEDKIEPSKEDCFENIENLVFDSLCESLELLFNNQNSTYNSINRPFHYFKYFAGHYRKNEISAEETIAIQDKFDDEYLNSIKNIIKNQQTDSYITHLRIYLQNYSEYNIQNVFNKLLLFVYEYTDSNKSLLYTNSHRLQKLCNAFTDPHIFSLFLSLFSTEDTERKEQIKNAIIHFLDSTEDRDITFAIAYFITKRTDCPNLAYNRDDAIEWFEKEERKFVSIDLEQNPFTQNNYDKLAICSQFMPLGNNGNKIINNYFASLLQDVAKRWCYAFITFYSNGNIGWNETLKNLEIGSATLAGKMEYMNPYLSQEEKTAIIEISNTNDDLNKAYHNGNAFILAAQKCNKELGLPHYIK